MITLVYSEKNSRMRGLATITTLVCDIDDTLVYHPGYYQRGRINEFRAIRQELGLSEKQIAKHLKRKGVRLNPLVPVWRQAIIYENVLALGISLRRCFHLRQDAYDVSLLTPDPEIVAGLAQLSGHFTMVAASNSPGRLARAVIKEVGLGRIFQRVFGVDDLGYWPKPSPKFFTGVSERLGAAPHECLSVGDRADRDIRPALEAGYGGALQVRDEDHLKKALQALVEMKAESDKIRPTRVVPETFRLLELELQTV